MNITNDSIKSFLDGMATSISKENIELYKKLSDNFALPDTKVETVEDFYFKVIYPHKKFLSGLIKSEIMTENSDGNKLEFILKNSRFVELNFQQLIQKKEGSPCCADKSRSIISGLFRFFKDGIKINWNYSQEYTFHLPKKVFTTHDEIIEFYNAVESLYYGHYESYLLALQKTLKK